MTNTDKVDNNGIARNKDNKDKVDKDEIDKDEVDKNKVDKNKVKSYMSVGFITLVLLLSSFLV